MAWDMAANELSGCSRFCACSDCGLPIGGNQMSAEEFSRSQTRRTALPVTSFGKTCLESGNQTASSF